MDNKQPKKRSFGFVAIANMVAMVLVGVGFFIALLSWMGTYTQHGEGIDVPDVRGMMLSDATYALGEAGLTAVVSDSTYDKTQPAGCILEQIPTIGSRVKSGREIYLKVNARLVPTLVVPDIADNSSMREAEARLKALGFKIGPIEYTEGDKYWVYALKSNGRQVYAGERVPSDVPIVMVVGNNEMEAGEIEEGTENWSDAPANDGEEVEISLEDLDDDF